MVDTQTTPVTRPKRPLGVAVIAVFLLVDAVVGVGQLAIDTPLMTRTDTLLSITEWAPAGIVVLAVLRLVAAVGLWRGSRGAWVLAMLMVGIGLLISLALYWRGDPSYPRMVIDIVIAFYLNQGLVRDYFEGRTRMAVVAPARPGETGAQGRP